MTIELTEEEVALLKLMVANYTRRVSGRITYSKSDDAKRNPWSSKLKPEDYRHKELLVGLKDKFNSR